MTRRITVQIKSVYGNEMIYPVCEDAKRFAALAGTKTFTHAALQQIDALGFEIYTAPATSTLLRVA